MTIIISIFIIAFTIFTFTLNSWFMWSKANKREITARRLAKKRAKMLERAHNVVGVSNPR